MDLQKPPVLKVSERESIPFVNERSSMRASETALEPYERVVQ